MKCNMKTMATTGLVLLVVLAAAYAALPQFRTLVLSLGPSLLFLLCPLSMIIMMIGIEVDPVRRTDLQLSFTL